MDQETSEIKKEKKSGGKKLLIIFVVIIVFLALAVAAFYFVNKENLNEAGKDSQEVGAPREAVPLYKMFGPQDFTVNLANADQRRYLKATVTLGFEDKGLTKELEQRKAQVRDTIINVLRRQKVEDVLDISGTDRLRATMITELNMILSKGEIKEIYFTDFIIQ